ncbi:MAG: tellurite resistance methyltransferase TehB [Burkholderiaceae bacterium]|nr:tellurite resistance methyltransferase TehB [Burkholderiaceae bacterium]
MTARTPETPDLNARYGLNPPHSEVVQACRMIEPGKAMDMGCGGGRNALYLGQLGFDVTAVDANPNAVGMLQSVIEQEHIQNIEARVYDINEAALGATYDFIVCTVTLMFLDPTRVDAVIADMQQCTRAGGHNLVVAAMDTDEYPCPMNFPFTLRPGQLSAAYAGWELRKYNEDVGTMHNGARLQFATLLARKPA